MFNKYYVNKYYVNIRVLKVFSGLFPGSQTVGLLSPNLLSIILKLVIIHYNNPTLNVMLYYLNL